MTDKSQSSNWSKGTAPIAVVMISLNEAHNLEEVLQNLQGFAQEVFLVDSYSVDETVSLALKYGVHVVQRKFDGFGSQWNFALRELPINATWTMKLDPDERLDDALKSSLLELVNNGSSNGIIVNRKLWFMGAALPIVQPILRVWKTGQCLFTNVSVNEHPIVAGNIEIASGELKHFDSPDLDHWIVKQNRYTTMEAIWQFQGKSLAAEPKLLGSGLERRMWLKKHFWKLPGRFTFLFLYNYVLQGAWRAGKTGFIWSRLRSDVYRMWEYKFYEIKKLGKLPAYIPTYAGKPDWRVRQYGNESS